MKKRRRRPQRQTRDSDLGRLTPEQLEMHRQLQYLRAAGLTRQRKPSLLARSNGHAARRRDSGWVEERWKKWLEARRRAT
jgi:hypothetical protein